MKVLFVYNAILPRRSRTSSACCRGLQRDDLFTVVFDQVLTDTCLYADVVLPATTFLEDYDIARAVRPALRCNWAGRSSIRIGEARSNADVFGELGDRRGCCVRTSRAASWTCSCACCGNFRRASARSLEHGPPRRPPRNGAPDPVRRRAARRPATARCTSFPRRSSARHRRSLSIPARSRARRRSAGADLPGQRSKTISSTLGELPRPAAKLHDAPDRCRRREDRADGDEVRIFNALGEVRCGLQIGTWVRRASSSLPKGLWRRARQTATANDARARHADRHRRGRLLQRRAGRSGEDLTGREAGAGERWCSARRRRRQSPHAGRNALVRVIEN